MSDPSVYESLAELKSALKEKKVSVEELYVFYLGNLEQIIGKSFEPAPGAICTVEDPKRVIRITQVQGNGLSISMMVGDLDLLEAGKVKLIPQIVYKVTEQSDESQLAILTMYSEYLGKKSVPASNLVIPQRGGISPFGRR